jgi:hypothetical protein
MGIKCSSFRRFGIEFLLNPLTLKNHGFYTLIVSIEVLNKFIIDHLNSMTNIEGCTHLRIGELCR